MDAAANNFLVPATSWISLLVGFVLLALTILPLIETASRRRWVWFWSMFSFGPLAGIAWLVSGRWAGDQPV